VLAGAAVLAGGARLQLVVVPMVDRPAALRPAVAAGRTLLRHAKLPRSFATTIVMIMGIAAVAGVLTLVISQFVHGAPDLSAKAADGVRRIQTASRPVRCICPTSSCRASSRTVRNLVHHNQGSLTSGALSTATTLGHVMHRALPGPLHDLLLPARRPAHLRFLIGLLPNAAAARCCGAADVSWSTSSRTCRATVLVAFIDALGMVSWLAICRVPFAFRWRRWCSSGAFIPIVGATVSGAVAVLWPWSAAAWSWR
jgi:predicted PurR-regulated permease PerM